MLDNMTNQNLIILFKKLYMEAETEVEQKLLKAVQIEIQRRKNAGVI